MAPRGQGDGRGRPWSACPAEYMLPLYHAANYLTGDWLVVVVGQRS